MGGRETVLKVLGTKKTPDNWELLRRDQEDVKDFLHSLDFYVFFQNSKAIEAFGRSILEAIAANLVVILPPHYEEVFGRAAVYCSPWEVKDVVQRFRDHPDEYSAQIELARKTLHHNYTHEAYIRKVEHFLA